MGMTTAEPRHRVVAGVLRWFELPGTLRVLTLASVVANVVIVVTGGAVRLTGSGLGCPTWPSCTKGSLTPTKAYSFHGIIEFTNRQLTFVLGIVAVLTLLAAWRQRREVGLAVVALLGIPAQAVVGGITVLTDLNPWIVGAHFLVSMVILAVTMLLWWQVSGHEAVAVPLAAKRLSQLLMLVAAAVLVIGAVVTGSGPHAGNEQTPRIPIRPSSITQLHADAVMVLVGLTLGLVALLYAIRAPEAARRAVWWLFGIELAQGAIGYIQYFLGVPELLVAIHMLGACLVWIATLRVGLTVGAISRPRTVAGRQRNRLTV